MAAGRRAMEYRSEQVWGDLPVVHVSVGGRQADGRYRLGRARPRRTRRCPRQPPERPGSGPLAARPGLPGRRPQLAGASQVRGPACGLLHRRSDSRHCAIDWVG